jgi:L-ribulose-5-phosphate 3-epimerase UlaE
MISLDGDYISIVIDDDEVTHEVLEYYIHKGYIKDFEKVILSYEILDFNFINEMEKLEKLYNSLDDNYEAYEREHTIDEILND